MFPPSTTMITIVMWFTFMYFYLQKRVLYKERSEFLGRIMSICKKQAARSLLGMADLWTCYTEYPRRLSIRTNIWEATWMPKLLDDCGLYQASGEDDRWERSFAIIYLEYHRQRGRKAGNRNGRRSMFTYSGFPGSPAPGLPYSIRHIVSGTSIITNMLLRRKCI